MNNRPTEPGHYWWEDNYGDLHVAEFDKDTETMYTDCDGYDYLTVDEFEDLSNFKRWLGKAVPPKRLNKERLSDLGYEDPSPEERAQRLAQNVSMLEFDTTEKRSRNE